MERALPTPTKTGHVRANGIDYYYATFFMLPLMFMSSAFIQTSLMPGWMQAIASRNPLNWVVQIGRSALSAQPDWGAIGVRCGGLLVLAVACVAVSVATFRSYQKNV